MLQVLVHDANILYPIITEKQDIQILDDVYEASKRKIESVIPENTERAHKGDVIYLFNWLIAIGEKPVLPISEKMVLKFIFQHLEHMPEDVENKMVGIKKERGLHSIATVKRRLKTLSILHKEAKLDSPFTMEAKKLLVAFSKSSPMQKKATAITKDILENIIGTCGKEKLLDVRDKAMILFGWASGGRRRSEIAEAEYKNLKELPNGNYTYLMPHSKTDQEGNGNVVPVNGPAALALREWLQRSGVVDGYLFRSVSKGEKIGECITDVDVNRVVKKRCKLAGEEESLYSAHSLRSGFITQAGKNGCPIGDVMRLSCHTSISTAMGYYQAGNLDNNKAANLL
jgi:integrase